MKLKLSYVNSLPALPYGAFKIGGEVEIDSELEADKLLLDQMKDRFKIPGQLYDSIGILNPFVAERCLRTFLSRVHELQWHQVSDMAPELFDIPQLESERAHRNR